MPVNPLHYNRRLAVCAEGEGGLTASSGVVTGLLAEEGGVFDCMAQC